MKKPLTICPHCGETIDNRSTYKKEKIELMQELLKATWEENKITYIEDYPDRNFELELERMVEWIDINWSKAEKRSGRWNLFIRGWLSNARRAWKEERKGKEIRANLNKDNASINEFLELGKKRGIFDENMVVDHPYVLKTYASGYEIGVER